MPRIYLWVEKFLRDWWKFRWSKFLEQTFEYRKNFDHILMYYRLVFGFKTFYQTRRNFDGRNFWVKNIKKFYWRYALVLLRVCKLNKSSCIVIYVNIFWIFLLILPWNITKSWRAQNAQNSSQKVLSDWNFCSKTLPTYFF